MTTSTLSKHPGKLFYPRIIQWVKWDTFQQLKRSDSRSRSQVRFCFWDLNVRVNKNIKTSQKPKTLRLKLIRKLFVDFFTKWNFVAVNSWTETWNTSAVSCVISPAEQTWSISTIHYAAVLLYWRQTHFHYWIHHLLHKVFGDTNTRFHQCRHCKHCSTLSFVSIHENRNKNESRLLKWFKHKPERRRRTEKLKQTNVERQREVERRGGEFTSPL